MKHTFYFLLLISLMGTLSCENRNDVFKDGNTAPIILLADNEAMDRANDTLQIDLRYGESCVLYYEYYDNYLPKDSLIFGTLIYEGKQNSITARRIAHTNKILVENLSPINTLTDTITKATICIGLEDYYQAQGSAWIQVRVHANKAPVPQIDIEKKGEMEYRISAQKTTDPENDNITAFEYVIGSQAAQELIFNEIGYETENFNVYVPNANPGRAAKGGTYIVATPLQSVNHIFQEKGTYSISVRAKDGIGLWSQWKTKQIEVEN